MPMSSNSLKVHRCSEEKFDETYTEIPKYSQIKACKLYLDVAEDRGASAEVLRYINTVIPINKERLIMPTKTAKKTAKKTATKKTSAASRFKELIMEGKLSDDQIFSKVQSEFGLDDKKRSYVSWYRNNLIKQGQNPPEAPKKATKKVAKKATKKVEKKATKKVAKKATKKRPSRKVSKKGGAKK